MTDARDIILGRVRAALGDRPTAPVVDRSYARTCTGDPVALFAERVDDYRATVEIVTDLPAAIAAALAAHRVRRLVVPADLPPEWLPAALEVLPDEPPLSVPDLEGADGVLTGAALGIALTGTIVLDAGRGPGPAGADAPPGRAHLRGAGGSDRRHGA